jgi:hypothetical protein
MLYTEFIMNTKPNVPEEIFMGKEEYSWRIDWRVNGWLFLAALLSGFSDVMFPQVTRQWPLGLRVSIVVIEFGMIALWARDLRRWICGMDELHRRTTTTAVLFAVGATFFFMMLWHGLEKVGFFAAIMPTAKHGGGWDICTVGLGFLLMTYFYFGAQALINRRYR